MKNIILTFLFYLPAIVFTNADESSLILKSPLWSKDIEVKRVTIYRVLANPVDFNKLNVQMQGCFKFEFKHSSIYPSKESAEFNRVFDGIWLDLSKLLINKELSDKLISKNFSDVLVEGVFSEKSLAPYGYSTGTIEVHRIVIK